MSLPNCLWEWERGVNKFPVNQYGIFTILLYDAYGNKVAGSTGGSDRNIIPIYVIFQKYGDDLKDLIVDVNTTWRLTYQVQYGFCIVSIYCTTEGKYRMNILDEYNRSLINTPTEFVVLPGLQVHLLFYSQVSFTTWKNYVFVEIFGAFGIFIKCPRRLRLLEKIAYSLDIKTHYKLIQTI